MFKVREKNIQVILILENEQVKELKDALILGIYDIIFDPFDLDEVCNKITNPNPFSKISKYIKEIQELDWLYARSFYFLERRFFTYILVERRVIFER